MNLVTRLENKSKTFYFILGFLLIGIIGFLDLVTGYEFAFSVFYVLPISLFTWFIGRKLGIFSSVVSAFVWLGADMAAGNTYSSPLIPYWNSIIRLLFYILITVLLSSVHNLTELEKVLSRTDNLTGAANLRHFLELVQMEIDRLQRYGHPFSLAYFDLDNFKTMNDQFGHSTGDDILCSVVNSINKNIRKTDTVTRLGGDEFALLLPFTTEEAAKVVLPKIKESPSRRDEKQ